MSRYKNAEKEEIVTYIIDRNTWVISAWSRKPIGFTGYSTLLKFILGQSYIYTTGLNFIQIICCPSPPPPLLADLALLLFQRL